MKGHKIFAGSAVLAAALLAGMGAFAPADASYTVTLAQDGSNVVASGSGSLDLGALTYQVTGESQFTTFSLTASQGQITTGGTGAFDNGDFYTYSGIASGGFQGPTSFGTGSLTDANSGTGDLVGYINNTDPLIVPAGYVSGGSLSSSATWDNASLASLGVIPGTYTWSWGAGTAHPDSFTLHIEAVPEPSSLALLALPFGVLLWLSGRRRRTRLAI